MDMVSGTSERKGVRNAQDVVGEWGERREEREKRKKEGGKYEIHGETKQT